MILNNTQSTEKNIKVYLDSVQNVDKPALFMNLTNNEYVLFICIFIHLYIYIINI